MCEDPTQNQKHTLEFISERAFEAITVFIFKVQEEGIEKIENIYDDFQGINDRFWKQYFPDLSNERELSREIIAGQHDTMLKVATPEAKGFLISYLAKTSLSRTEETQEYYTSYNLEKKQEMYLNL